MSDVVVDERHDAVLRTILRLEPGPELPDDLKAEYVRFKKPADRIGCPITDGDLIRIALAYAGSTDEFKPYSFLDVLKAGKVGPGSKVLVEWRGSKVVGTYVKARHGRVSVILEDGTAEERSINPSRVWVYEE